MFNPLVDSFAQLSDAEVENKMLELQRKYYMTHNPQVQDQIVAILDMYREEARARRAKQYQQQQEQNGENGLDNLIKVS
jgi:small-conductance mechanosensitive channel